MPSLKSLVTVVGGRSSGHSTDRPGAGTQVSFSPVEEGRWRQDLSAAGKGLEESFIRKLKEINPML